MDGSVARSHSSVWRQVLALAALLVAATSSAAPSDHGPARVDGITVSPVGAATRVVFNLSGPVASSVFTLTHPDRVVIDLKSAVIDAPRLHLPAPEPPIRHIRAAPRGHGDVRVVLDLDRGLRPHVVAAEPGTDRARLVVDLVEPGAAVATHAVPVEVPTVEYGSPRDLVIAIDAGHGGDDPGATGRDGTREKDVTLAVARALAARVNAEPGMRAVLTRTGDYFVPLRERIHRARVAQADLFVSVHADAVADRSVAGSSVYVLSQRGASSEAAKWLADRENAADLVGGVSLDDKDGVLASVLLDLSQSAAMSASMVAAEKVLDQLNEVGEVRKARVQQAGFVVLKSPDIPSLLIESAYITNPGEERRLRDPRHQARLAEAILTGIRNYFRANPPPGSRLAALIAAPT
jgi:N-acetylmuramoyl-L-alanine amidase